MSKIGVIRGLWERKVVRFAVVGVLNTLTDLTILNVLVFVFGLKVLVANIFSASISIVLSYFWNHAIVFRREHQRSARLFLKFVVVTGLSILAVQSLIIYGAEHVLSVHDIVRLSHLPAAKAHFIQVNLAKLSAVVGGMVWNFALYNLVVFKHPAEKADIDEEGIVPY